MKQEGAEERAGGDNSGRHEEKAKRGREGRDKLLKPARTERRVAVEKKKKQPNSCAVLKDLCKNNNVEVSHAGCVTGK